MAGITLEVDTPGVGMLRDTPTAPQTWTAKARVTGRKMVLSATERTYILWVCRVEVGWGRSGWERGKTRGGGFTLLVCNGTDGFDHVVQRGHELRVAADTLEVGYAAARGGDAGFCCVLLEKMVLGL